MTLKKLLIFSAFFINFSCTAQKSTIPIPKESYPESSVSEPFKKGYFKYLNNGKTVQLLSKLDTSRNNAQKLILTDSAWNTHWESINDNKKVSFFSTQNWKTKQNNSEEIKNIDISAMEGYDLSPMVVYLKKDKPWEGKSFIQHYFRVKGENENKSIWQDGPKKYFLKPKEMVFNTASNLPQYYNLFPDYNLPKNKIAINNFRTEEITNKNALNKGNTFIGDNRIELSKQAIYDYDDWLYSSGCPRAYSVPPDEVSKWLSNVDEKMLLRNFVKDFYNRYKNYGYVVMDLEALNAGFYGKGVYKIENCLKFWESHPHTAKLAVWNYQGFGLSRVHIESNNESYAIENALNFKGNIADFEAQGNTSPFSLNGILAKYVDNFLIGGYLNYPTNFGFIHHFLIQEELNSKFYPEKKNLLSWWHNQEYVGDFELGWTYFKTSKGQPLKKYIKPMVFPDAMYNAAVWSFSIADGGDLWSEPYYRTNNSDLYGWGGNTFKPNDEKMNDNFGPKSEIYAEQNYQNIDWWEAGKWAISQNKDIIEAKSSWVYTVSKRGSETKWNDKQAALPHFSLYKNTPLAAYKLSDSKKEALLILYDAWSKPTAKQTISVIIEKKQYEIDVFGRYSSVVRVAL